jgi:hypothetical protein
VYLKRVAEDCSIQNQQLRIALLQSQQHLQQMAMLAGQEKHKRGMILKELQSEKRQAQSRASLSVNAGERGPLHHLGEPQPFEDTSSESPAKPVEGPTSAERPPQNVKSAALESSSTLETFVSQDEDASTVGKGDGPSANDQLPPIPPPSASPESQQQQQQQQQLMKRQRRQLQSRETTVERHVITLLQSRNRAMNENLQLRKLLLSTCADCRSKFPPALRRGNPVAAADAHGSGNVAEGGADTADIKAPTSEPDSSASAVSGEPRPHQDQLSTTVKPLDRVPDGASGNSVNVSSSPAVPQRGKSDVNHSILKNSIRPNVAGSVREAKATASVDSSKRRAQSMSSQATTRVERDASLVANAASRKSGQTRPGSLKMDSGTLGVPVPKSQLSPVASCNAAPSRSDVGKRTWRSSLAVALSSVDGSNGYTSERIQV